MKTFVVCIFTSFLFLFACNSKRTSETTLSGLSFDNFKDEINGKPTALYVLKNRNNMEICITNFGGRIVSVMVYNYKGEMQDVVLGFDNIQDYVNIPSDFGASIGRYANRINQGKLVIDGDTIQLPQNNFGHSLHGGPEGWQYQVYTAKQIDEQTLELTLESPDGDANYPGNVTATVTYHLTDDNTIDIQYKATTDKKTIINMTNHSYFNLSGDARKPITDHRLYINATHFTPVDSTFMTTGEIITVEDTPMDFTIPKKVGEEIDFFEYEQLKNGNGYDHNWVLNTNGDISALAARLSCPETGIVLEVFTNEPGIQVYTGNFLDGTIKGKNNVVYNQRSGICLETQHYPDSPNKPEWPSVYLEPGQVYTSQCIFKFSIEE